MTDNQWVFDLETNVYSNLISIAKPLLKAKYPKLDFDAAFTTVQKNLDKDPVFPTIYVHEMPGIEVGADLEGNSVNAVQETFQVDVITNTSQSQAKSIMAIVASAFKQMRFQITAMPEFKNDSEKKFRSVARFRRVIGANDRLL